jgi:hypothetical protein
MTVIIVRATHHPKYPWGSPDLSVGIKKLFKLIKLNKDYKFLLISMDLGNIRSMIQWA